MRIWYLSPMRAAKVQASLRIRAVSPEPLLLAHTSSESRGTFRQKARSLAPLNGWACAVEICHDVMFEDTNSLDGAQVVRSAWRTSSHQCTKNSKYTKQDEYSTARSTLHSLLGKFGNRYPLDQIIETYYMSPVKRICVFEHSVMTNFNCACPAIQRGQGSGFLSEGSSWLTACMSELRRFWRDCADAQARLNLRCSHRL